MFQKIYMEKILCKFNHTDCFSVAVPADPNINFNKIADTRNNMICMNEFLQSNCFQNLSLL